MQEGMNERQPLRGEKGGKEGVLCVIICRSIKTGGGGRYTQYAVQETPEKVENV